MDECSSYCSNPCCIEYKASNIRSGIPNYECNHVASSKFANYAPEIKLSAETLQKMVEKKYFHHSHAHSCMNLYNHASAEKSPLISAMHTWMRTSSLIVTYLCQYTLGA